MCHCIDAKLKDKGFKISEKLITIRVPEFKAVLVIPLERVDGAKLKRNDPKTVEASFCPFCGTRLK